MPELPEVQCLVNDLQRLYTGAKVAGILLRRSSLRGPLPVLELRKVFVKGATLTQFRREGKRIILSTSHGVVCISLGMSGNFLPSHLKKPLPNEHISLSLADGRVLGFVDPRRFGSWIVGIPKDIIAVNPLSNEQLLSLFFSAQLQGSSRRIKDFLMDQKLIGGVGNIYAMEALFQAGIQPSSKCCNIPKSRLQRLAEVLPKILQRAIRLGGSSIASYRKHDGNAGNFQTEHLVYGRDGEPCQRERCNGTIVREVHGARGSWHCPKCQRCY